MNEEQIKKLLEEFKSSLPVGMTKDEIESAIKAKTDELKASFPDVTELKSRLDDIAAKITDLDEKQNRQRKSGDVPELVSKEAFDTIKTAMTDGRKVEIPLKAASIITTANFANSPHSFTTEVDRTINAPAPPEMVILNRLVRGRTNAQIIFWINRVNEEGGAAFIEEGALKPLKDWERTEESSVAKKVAVMATLTTEALTDVIYMESELREILYGEVIQEIADKVLNGNSTTNPEELTGILSKATSYTTTALDDSIERANRADAIRAAMLQMRLLRMVPDVVFLNPGDAAILDLTKDANGNYIKIQIDGVLQRIQVLETTEIEPDHFLLMDTRKWKLRMLEDITSRWGYNEDDFSHNRISVVFEARLHSYINSIDQGAVIYDDFTSVIAAIQAPDSTTGGGENTGNG